MIEFLIQGFDEDGNALPLRTGLTTLGICLEIKLYTNKYPMSCKLVIHIQSPEVVYAEGLRDL